MSARGADNPTAGAHIAHRRFCFAATLAVLLGVTPSLAAPLALVGGTLIDGTGAPPVADATVVIDGDRIVAAGPGGSIAIPADAERFDARGKWVLPGFIDAHVHFFQSGGLYARPDILDLRTLRSYGEEIAAVRAAIPATLARTLAAGITGVVDFGGPLWTFDVRALAETLPYAPRVAASGPLLATRFPPALAADDPPMIEVHTPVEGRAVVRSLLPRHPDLIKIWFIQARPNIEPQMEWVRAVIAEAHEAGIAVAVHATELHVARAVVEAGADVLVHGVDDAVADAAFQFQLKAQGVVYTPTFAVNENYSRVLGLSFRPTALETRLGDPTQVRSLLSLAELQAAGRLRGVRPTPVPPLDPESAANVRRLQALGVVIAAGSDAGNIGTLPGAGFHRELELLVAAGLSTMEALVAATKGSAAAMRRKDVGTVEVGKRADLVLLDADPLADIRNSSRVFRVVKAGIVLDPEAILRSAELR